MVAPVMVPAFLKLPLTVKVAPVMVSVFAATSSLAEATTLPKPKMVILVEAVTLAKVFEMVRLLKVAGLV